MMDENDFEGTLVLEKLAEVDALDAFFEAIDSDNFEKARQLMFMAGVSSETIHIVMVKMAAGDGKH